MLDVQDFASLASSVGKKAAAALQRELLFPAVAGRTFYVCNATWDGITGSDTYGGRSPKQPLATLAAAIALCTTGRGDRIIILPGHAENIATAGAITVDKANVSIIGIGNGTSRPTFTWTGTAGTFLISAANVLLQNIRCTSGIDEVVKMFSITGDNCTLDGVDHFETATFQTIQFLLTTAAADNLTIKNCKHVQRTAATATQIWMQFVGINDLVMTNNLFMLTLKNETASYTIGGTTACVDAFLYRNTFIQTGDTANKLVNFATGTTGIMRENGAFTGTGIATTTAFVGDAMGMIDNKWHDSAAASGLLTPAVDTDT